MFKLRHVFKNSEVPIKIGILKNREHNELRPVAKLRHTRALQIISACTCIICQLSALRSGYSWGCLLSSKTDKFCIAANPCGMLDENELFPISLHSTDQKPDMVSQASHKYSNRVAFDNPLGIDPLRKVDAKFLMHM